MTAIDPAPHGSGPNRGTGSPSPAVALVSLRGIRKSFGPVEVLHGVDFDVRPGEVHVLAGENGAGKSTLVKILSGVHASFSGELRVGDRPRRFSHPADAARAGIATIHQELSLVPAMSVADNLFLGREAADRLGRVDFRRQAAEAARVLADAGLECRPDQSAGELPLSAQQMLEIARALARDASVIVFDEPTSALTEREAESLFRRVAALKERGRGIVYITHRMEEIYRLADRITVLRDGVLVGTATPDALPPSELVRWMVGRDVGPPDRLRPDFTLRASSRPRRSASRGGGQGRGGPPELHAKAEGGHDVLDVRDLTVTHPSIASQRVVNGLSFTVGRGEIVGLAGLQGSGASEALHAVFGAFGRRATGTARVNGEPFPMRGPRESIARGVVLLTNDRKTLGLAASLSVTHNVSLASLQRFTTRGGWMRREAERAAVGGVTRELRLRAPSLDAPVGTLSGGNQQKAYLARCLLARPRVLLLDEPTRGIDVGAKADIYDLMRSWVARGIAIVLITSEMDELLTLADRVLVMHRGRLAAELVREAATRDAVLAAAMGHAVPPRMGGTA